MPGVWRLRVLQQLARWGVREETLLIVMAVVVGFVAAGAAWVFEKCVDLIQHHYFQYLVDRFNLTGKWIFLLPFLPALGGLAVSIVRIVFRRAHSTVHGLSSVLLSLIRDRGRLRRSLGLEMLLTSSLTIGTGVPRVRKQPDRHHRIVRRLDRGDAGGHFAHECGLADRMRSGGGDIGGV